MQSLKERENLYRRVFGGADGEEVLNDLVRLFDLDRSISDTNIAFRALGNYEVIQHIRGMIDVRE